MNDRINSCAGAFSINKRSRSSTSGTTQLDAMTRSIAYTRYRDRKLPHGRQNVIRHLFRSRVYQQRAIVAYRNSNVAPGANEHVDVALHREDVQIPIAAIYILLGVGGTKGNQN